MSRLRIHGVPDSRAFRSLLGADLTVADLNLAAVSYLALKLVLVGDAAAQRIAIGWIMISGPFRSGAAGAVPPCGQCAGDERGGGGAHHRRQSGAAP